MFLDLINFIDLLMNKHLNSLDFIALVILIILAIRIVKLLEMKGDYHVEKKEIISKKSKTAIQEKREQNP